MLTASHLRDKRSDDPSEDIVLDDANCFRWLRDMYTQFASEDGYAAELA